MMDDKDVAGMAGASFVVGVMLTILVFAIIWPEIKIESKKVIVPDKVITITNGISDTTYIYK